MRSLPAPTVHLLIEIEKNKHLSFLTVSDKTEDYLGFLNEIAGNTPLLNIWVIFLAQSAGAVEYINCTCAEG